MTNLNISDSTLAIITIIAFFITVIALFIAIYQTIQAKNSDKKLEETKENLKKIEDNMVLSDFKLQKAVEYYEDGRYNDSLQAFKKYLKESEDYVEAKNFVDKIFMKETRKIYSSYIGQEVSSAMLVVMIMTRHKDTTAKYPEYINKIIDACDSFSNTPSILTLVPVLLNQEKYNDILKIVPEKKSESPQKNFNRNFSAFIRNFCLNKIQTDNNDNFDTI